MAEAFEGGGGPLNSQTDQGRGHSEDIRDWSAWVPIPGKALSLSEPHFLLSGVGVLRVAAYQTHWGGIREIMDSRCLAGLARIPYYQPGTKVPWRHSCPLTENSGEAQIMSL